MLRHLQICGLSLALALSVGQTHAATVDVSGVKFEDTIDQRGSKLVLNGAGTRYKAVFKVYSAGLYLPKKNLHARRSIVHAWSQAYQYYDAS